MKRGGIQELRFTRNRWGAILCAMAVLLFLASLAVGLACLVWPNPYPVIGEAAGKACAAVTAGLFLLSLAMFRFGIILLRRSYIVASVLGLDILPLFRPSRRMILIGWNELESVALRGSCLVLARRAEPSLQVPLGCMRARQRWLLLRVVEGRLQQQREGGAPSAPCL